MADSAPQLSPGSLAIAQAWSDGLRPDPILGVAAWADSSRFLDSRNSPEPGPWRTDRVPYLREPMNRLSADDPCEDLYLMFGAQLGKSELINNAVGYVIDCAPGPVLFVQPTAETAEAYSRERIAPLISACPSLRGKVGDPKTRDSGNLIGMKEFPGGQLAMVGANAPSGLASRPCRYVFGDELDRWPLSAGNEGSPWEIAKKRTANFWNRKRVGVSTPTDKDISLIERLMLTSDWRRYWVPCPHCGTPQVLEWTQVKWPDGRPHEAWYECIGCGASIQNHEKTEMLARGEWRASRPENASTKRYGYHMSSLYCPHGWTSFGDLASEYVAALDDPALMKVFYNTRLALTWDESKVEQTDESPLMERREDWGDELPAGVLLLTMGVDVQDNRLEAEVVGWGVGMESWSVDMRIIRGDPTSSEVWASLDALLATQWRTSDGRLLTVESTCIDSGGHCTQSVYDYCKDRWRLGVRAIIGRGGPRRIWPQRSNRIRRRGRGSVDLFTIGVDTAKDEFFLRLAITSPGPGYCHFSVQRDKEYFRQLTAEKRTVITTNRRRRVTYEKAAGRRNEALDIRIYAVGGLYAWMEGGMTLESLWERIATERQKAAYPAQQPPAERPRAPSVWSGPKRGLW